MVSSLNSADLDNNFTFLIGNGSEDSAMIFSTEASLNTALDGMTYTPNADYNESDGTSTLSLTISDQGQTGSGGTRHSVHPYHSKGYQRFSRSHSD